MALRRGTSTFVIDVRPVNRYDRTKQRFVLTPEHLKLMQHMWVGWQDIEFGAPGIDPKRPYGNSDVVRDLWEILLTEGTTWDDDDELPDEVVDNLTQIHRSMQIALQVVLTAQSFEPGTYVADQYDNVWHREF